MDPSKIERKCIICGEDLKILINETREYAGGHYFGKVKFPVGEGENRYLGKTKILDLELKVIEWTGNHDEIEYWECESCFNEE